MSSLANHQPRFDFSVKPMQPIASLDNLGVPLSKSTTTLMNKLNRRIDAFNAEVGTFTDQAQKLAEASAEELVSAEASLSIDELPRERLRLLRAELDIRRQMTMFFSAWDAERLVACSRMIDELEQAKVELRAKLIDIGYVEGLIPGGNTLCLTPIFFMNHPRLFALKGLVSQYRDTIHPSAGTNAERCKAIQREIESLRTNALRAVKLATA